MTVELYPLICGVRYIWSRLGKRWPQGGGQAMMGLFNAATHNKEIQRNLWR